ncbi:MAG: sulfatase-like hydrolase/transferase [Candidatus Pacebacteria bacterium]|nr:sulfatase-like hydrolase/transferase [Candidatus Paceibacterota bacterium]
MNNKPPNILILMTDQQRQDCLGCAGHSVLKTPNLDRIAATGTRFTEATTVSPVCMPARASFVNSLYPHNHGMWWNSGEMPPDDPTMFHLLKEAGYFNAHIGKAHYYVHEGVTDHLKNREPYMRARGFDYIHETTGPFATLVTRSYMTDEWERKGERLYRAFKDDYASRQVITARPSPLSVEDYSDSYVGRKAVEFIESYDKNQPVCLFVGFGGPHDPWDAPGEYAAMYEPSSIPPPIPPSEHFKSLPKHVQTRPDLTPNESLTPEIIRAIRANYYGNISLIDDWIGKILQAAARKGWDDNLMVVFWSDHGELLGDHGRTMKCTFHESSVRVPLVLSWPGVIPHNVTSDALAEIIDVFPTVADLLGLDIPTRCLGKSLTPLFANPDCPLRDFQLSEIAVAVWNGVRNTMIGNRKYKYADDEQGTGYMLFNLEADPDEQRNLIADPEARDLENILREELLKRLLEAQYTM